IRQIEDKLGRVPGVDRLQFDLVRRRLLVDGSITEGEVRRAIHSLGMRARLEGETTPSPTFWVRHGRLVTAVISGVMLAVAGLLILRGVGGRITVPLLAISAIAGGWFIAPRGLRAARSGVLDMNFLMSIAAIGAAAIGKWGEGASAMFLFSLAQMLEVYSMDRARNAIKALMSLSPPEATVRREGREETVPVDQVLLGEMIIVRPGQRLPLDGTVVSGRSAVNQGPITGESIPVDKEPGSEVFAGSINAQGLLEVRVTKLVEDTTLARIIHAVEEAQATRAPSQSFVDRFSRIYTPTVVAVAVFVFLVPPLAGLGAWNIWFYRALTMLVIACPCALVISTPVSIVSALAAAARNGVLIKGGLFIELPARLKAIALDKTGTLSRGEPIVVQVLPLNRHTEEELLERAAALEARSAHPLARAVARAAAERGVPVKAATEVAMMQGKGVTGVFEGERFWLGSHRYLEERGQETPEVHDKAEAFEREGQTVVAIGNERHVCGLLAIADTVRAEAAGTVKALRAAGIEHVVMLTGDNRTTAQTIARQAGIDEVRPELLPEDKVAAIAKLVERYGAVAMVGDGVNDAPAM